MKKLLIVRLSWWRRRIFNEHLDEWERLVIENGVLIVIRPDGCKNVFAAGVWRSYLTVLVEA